MIVLTGGAGFIGSCFLKKLNDNGINEVLVVDNLGNGEKWKNLVGKKYLSFVNKNEFILDLLSGNYNDEGIELIVHLGACTVTTERDTNYLIENNYQYSIDLSNFAAENGIRFIYASSAATYGKGDSGYSDKTIDNLKPLNAYGFSKQAFDEWVINNDFDKYFTGLKFFNVYGPNEYHKNDMASMVFKSFNQILQTGKVKLFKSTTPDFKDGEQLRDFIYVKDVTEVMWNIINERTFFGLYNLGSGFARTWNSLASAVFNSMGLAPDIEYIDMPDNLINQYQNRTEADMSKLNKTNCSIAFTSLEDGIKDYVQNYLMKDWKYL